MCTEVTQHTVESRFDAEYWIGIAKKEGKTLRDLDGFIANMLWAPGVKEYFLQLSMDELSPD